MMKISIKRKLVTGITGIVLVVAAGLGMLSISQASRAMRAQTEENITVFAVNAANQIAAVLDGYLILAREMAENPEITSMDWNRQQTVLEQQTARNGFLGMGIIAPDGTARYLDGSSAQLGDREYFRQAMRGEAGFSDVLVSRVTNSAVMIMAAPIHDDSGRVVSVLLVRLDANWLGERVKTMGFGYNGYAYIIDGRGVVIAHDNREFVLDQRNFLEEGRTNPEYALLSSMFQRMITGETGFDEYPFMGSVRFFGFAPIPASSWSVAVGAHRDDVFAQIHVMRNLILLLSFIFVVAAFVLVWLFSVSISRPILAVVEMLKDISEGEGDLTRQINVHSSDEIGDMARYFNLSFEKIRNLVALVKKQSVVLQDVGVNLSSNMSETAAAINEISANIKSVKNQTTNQSASVIETSATIEQITNSIERLNRLIEDQSAM